MSLLEVEKEQKRNVVNDDTFAIVTSRVGIKTQKIISGKLSELLKMDFGEPPHSIIITGKLQMLQFVCNAMLGQTILKRHHVVHTLHVDCASCV